MTGEASARAGTQAAMEERRRRIDELDERLVALLNARAACALEIGRLKEALGMDIYQPSRERDVLEHVTRVNAGPLDDGAIGRLFERIIDEARRLERVAQEAERHEPTRAPDRT
jgi:chorismate mutase